MEMEELDPTCPGQTCGQGGDYLQPADCARNQQAFRTTSRAKSLTTGPKDSGGKKVP